MLPLWDNQPYRRQPTMTMMLIGVNLMVFGNEIFLANRGTAPLEAFLRTHALVPARLVANSSDPAQWATIFSSMFVHGSTAHVLGNCWSLWCLATVWKPGWGRGAISFSSWWPELRHNPRDLVYGKNKGVFNH